MTAKTGAEKEQKQVQHQQVLKGTLAAVLEKTPQEPEKLLKPAAESPRPQPSPAAKQPFEVPEDALRQVLKGGI